PYLSAAPWWMCAAVGVKPLAVTLPLTLPSSLIVMVPLPEPLLFTGGTSWSPDSFTFIDSASAAADVQARTIANDHVDTCCTLFDLRNAFIVNPHRLTKSETHATPFGRTGVFGAVGTANPIRTNTPPGCGIPEARREGPVYTRPR